MLRRWFVSLLLLCCCIATKQLENVVEHAGIRLQDLLLKVNQSLIPPYSLDATLKQLNTVYHEGNICPFKYGVAHKLVAAQPIEVYIMGGSVTYGADLKDRIKERWTTYFEELMNAGWYNSKINVHNIAKPACNIDTWLNKVNELVKADLILVDLSVNDQGFDLPALPQFYGTLIQLFNNIRPGRQSPAIIFLYAFRTAKFDSGDIQKHCPDNSTSGTCCGGYVYCRRWWDMQDYTAMALHQYGVPYISYRDLFWPQFDFPPDNLPVVWNGMSHPDLNSHRLFAKMMAYAVMMQIRAAHSHESVHCSPSGKGVHLYHDTSNAAASSDTVEPICRNHLSSYMAANASNPLISFETVDNTKKYWKYYSDSKDKFGWILETTKSALIGHCGPQSKPELCDTAVREASISFPVVVSAERPVIQLTFLKSYSDNMCTATVWLDDDYADRVVVDSHWEYEYSVAHLVTLSASPLTNVSSVLRGDNLVIKSLNTAKEHHTLHVSIGSLDISGGENYKFKVLAVTSC